MATVLVLFRSRSFARWFFAAVVGRLSAAMAPIAMLVVGSQVYGSVGVGARLAAVVSISTAVLAPLQGRRLDRRGPARGLRVALWLSSLAGLAMAGAVHGRLEAPWIDLMAVGLGLSLAVIPAGFRALLSRIVDDHSLGRASNLDAVGFELSLISAPVVVAGVAALSQPAVLFAVGAVLTGVGAVMVPAGGPLEEESVPPPWRRLPAPWVMTAALLLGVSGGLMEPAVFARVAEMGRSESLASLLLAVVGVGSALGGIVTSIRSPSATAAVAGRFLALHGLAVVAVAFGAQAWTLAVWLFLAGVPIAPLMAVGATLLDRRVPMAERSTAFALAGSAIALGTGLGQALAGYLISKAVTTTLFLAAASVALATAAAVSIRMRPSR